MAGIRTVGVGKGNERRGTFPQLEIDKPVPFLHEVTVLFAAHCQSTKFGSIFLCAKVCDILAGTFGRFVFLAGMTGLILMTDIDQAPNSGKRTDFGHLGELNLPHLTGKLELNMAGNGNQKLRWPDYVTLEEIEEALRTRGANEVPGVVLRYHDDLLAGRIAKPRGRKPLPDLDKGLRRDLYRYVYDRYYNWLRDRKTLYGHLNGWSSIQEATFWCGPIHERAARMTACRFGLVAGSWAGIKNIISSERLI
jgi:hypothetical protein